MAFQRMIIRPIPTHNRQKPTPSHPASSGSSQTPTVLYFHTRPLPAWTRQRQSPGRPLTEGPWGSWLFCRPRGWSQHARQAFVGPLREADCSATSQMVPLCFPAPALGPIHKGSGRHRLQSNCHAPGHKGKEETGNADVLAAVAAQRVTHECGQDAVRTALSVLQLLSRCSSRPYVPPRATAGPRPAPQPVAQHEARPCICVSTQIRADSYRSKKLEFFFFSGIFSTQILL